MLYTTEDVFKMIIRVEERATSFYHMFAQTEKIERDLKTLALVLAAEERRHQKLYRQMMVSYAHSDVPLDLYHKTSQLLSRFQPTLESPPSTIETFLSFAVDLERENLALVIRLRDLFRERKGQEELLERLDDIVKEEESHVDHLDGILRRRRPERA